MFIDSGKIISFLGKEQPLTSTREEIKVDLIRNGWKMWVDQGWRRTKPVWKDS